MTIFACLGLAALSLVPAGQNSDKADWLGKTRDQILQMGSDRWFDYYTGKKGDSNLAMAVAFRVYSDCLHSRSAERVRDLPDKAFLLHAYHAVFRYGADCFPIEARGGGTMWIPIAAGQHEDIEEMLNKMLNDDAPSDKVLPRDIAAFAQEVLAHHDVIAVKLGKWDVKAPPSGYGRKELLERNAKAKQELEKLIPALVKRNDQVALDVLTTMNALSDPATVFADEGD